MKYILFPEGRILNNNGAFEYEYHLKDHLGSVRVAFTAANNTKTVVQENAYYPFGATIGDLSYAAPLNNNRYGYTGQEQLNDFDLNWYDYIARNYNPLIGRFNSIDPLAEKYYSISPYAYCNNNPVRYTDPTGKFPIETIWDIGNVLYDFGAAVVNHIKGDHQAAKSNWVDLGLDAGAMLIPYVPAGATKALKVADKAVDAATDTKKITNITENAAKGKAFENTVTNEVKKAGHTDVAGQITVKAENGTKTRVDIISKDANGKVQLTEAKSSSTAPLTKNQQLAFPSIEQNGGVVVGKGKSPFEGGTQIPPTKVEIIRPDDLLKLKK